MENQPLVSIITITRNRGKLIGRCIDSVLNQTYKNIEHIVVDGASDDNTDAVLSSYNDSRLVYRRLDYNWPLIETANEGVRLAKGEYIAFLDSDDEYHPDKIEKQMALMQTLDESYGMVYCWMTYYDNQTREVLRVHTPNVRGMVADRVLEKPVVSGTPTFLFRKQAFISDAGWRDDIGIISDWEMAARFCQKWKVDFIPESLINVYVNHGSIRQSDKGYYKNLDERILQFHSYFLKTYESFFSKNPTKGRYHYYNLSRSLFRLRRYKEGLKYYMLLLRSKPSFKQIVVPLYNIFAK